MGWSAIPIYCTMITSLMMIHMASADTLCSNPPPGVKKMVRGVDITVLDLVPLGSFGKRGVKSPVINFTCNQGNTWKSSSGKTYQLPDQIWQMTSAPGGWMSANVKIFRSGDAVRKYMNQNVGGKGSLFKFSFSGSLSYKKMQNTITNTSRYVEYVSAFESAVRVDFVPDWILQLDRFAKTYLDRFVTGNYTTHKQVYDKFVTTFGTHYFSSANFGGLIRTYLETNKDYVYSKSEQEIKSEAKASYLKSISLHGGGVSGSTSASESFKKSSTDSTSYYGGYTNLLASGGMGKWQATVDDDPWLFSGQLQPISDLITDPVKKENIKKAVKEHVLRSFLDELHRIIDGAKKKTGHAVLKTLEEKLDLIQKKETLVEKEVEKLANLVKFHTTVPSWFRDNTKLCLRWGKDHDNSQCSGNSRLLCSTPNSRTPAYNDDTDERPGGCNMQWGITSFNYPSWFEDVQVCIKWDGSNGQCGGPARVMCAPVNSYTGKYHDDTDERGGGCSMKWKIIVPDDAPLWMKIIKFCLYWSSEHNNSQCGPRPSTSLCATGDQWTPTYYDDTDERPGGCSMSWEISALF